MPGPLLTLLLVAVLATTACAQGNKNANEAAAKPANVTKSSPLSAPELGTVLCRTHTVAPGDNPLTLAQKYNVEFDDVVAALRECVGYTDTFLNVGQEVCLPPYFPACKNVDSVTSRRPNCKVYTVQQGETLAMISSSLGIDADALVELNGAGELQTGQKVKLTPWHPGCPDPTEIRRPSCRLYSANAGDSLSKVATGFQVPVNELIAANPGITPDMVLAVGLPLRIPPFPNSCGTGTKVTTFPTDNIKSCRAYAVTEGDSIASIALAFGSVGAEIVTLNPELVDPSLLTVGDSIKIPPWDDSCPEEGVLVSPDQPKTPSVQQKTPPPAGPSPPRQGVPSKVVQNPPPPPAPVATPPPSDVDMYQVKVEMHITETTEADFVSQQQTVVDIIARAAGVPPANVTVTFVLPATSASRRRRALLAGEGVEVQCLVSGDPVTIIANLQATQAAGTLEAAFQQQNLVLEDLTVIDSAGTVTEIVAPEAAASATTEGSSSVPLGVIVGATVGGVAVIVGALSVWCCLTRKGKGDDDSEDGGEVADVEAGTVDVFTDTLKNKAALEQRAFDKTYRPRSPTRKPAADASRASSRSQSRSPSRSPARSPTRTPTRAGASRSDRALLDALNPNPISPPSLRSVYSGGYVIPASISQPASVRRQVPVEIPRQPSSDADSMPDPNDDRSPPGYSGEGRLPRAFNADLVAPNVAILPENLPMVVEELAPAASSHSVSKPAEPLDNFVDAQEEPDVLNQVAEKLAESQRRSVPPLQLPPARQSSSKTAESRVTPKKTPSKVARAVETTPYRGRQSTPVRQTTPVRSPYSIGTSASGSPASPWPQPLPLPLPASDRKRGSGSALNGTYVSPYAQQKTRTPSRSPSRSPRKEHQDRLKSMMEG